MKKTTLMLLASAALALPGALSAMAQNTPANQPPQAQSADQPQAQNQQPQAQNQQAQDQSQQPQGQNQQASSQSIPASQLGRSGVRQVQQALNKKGHRVGRADGIMGPRTREALQRFQKSKGMQASGKINEQTLADLGVQVAQRGQGNQPSSEQNNNQPNPSENKPGGNASPGNNQ